MEGEAKPLPSAKLAAAVEVTGGADTCQMFCLEVVEQGPSRQSPWSAAEAVPPTVPSSLHS